MTQMPRKHNSFLRLTFTTPISYSSLPLLLRQAQTKSMGLLIPDRGHPEMLFSLKALFL